MKKENKIITGILCLGVGLFFYSFIINEVYSYDYTIIPFFQFPAIAGILLSFILIGVGFLMFIYFLIFNYFTKMNKKNK